MAFIFNHYNICDQAPDSYSIVKTKWQKGVTQGAVSYALWYPVDNQLHLYKKNVYQN